MIDKELDIEEELTLRKLSRQNFAEFCQYVMPRYEFAALQNGRNLHREMAEVLENVAKGNIKRLLLSCPPRLGKSTLGGILLPARFLGRNPTKDFVLTSYDANLASDFGRKARDIVKSFKFKNVFPEFSLADDQDTKTHWETKVPGDVTRGGMYTVGVGGALTGKGGHILYNDDPVKNMEDSASPVIQEKTWDWFDSVVSTRKQNEDSAVVVTMTRWNVYDLHGKIKENEKDGGEKWTEVVIKAIDDKGCPIVRPGKRGPQYFIKERENRSHKVWEALFQQNPIAMSGNMFKPGNERRFLESDYEKVGGINMHDINLGIFVDPAFSTSSKSDDLVVAVIGQHQFTRNFYIFDVFAETQAPSIGRDMIFNLASKRMMRGFNKPFVSIEQVPINKDQTKFKQDFLDDMARRNTFYTLYDYMPKNNKLDRIKFELEPLRTGNRLYFNMNMPQEVKKKIQTQFNQFPNGKHDDVIDCIGQAVYQLTKGLIPERRDEKPKAPVIYDPVTNEIIRQNHEKGQTMRL